MAQARTLLDWLTVDPGSDQPLYRQIYGQIRAAAISQRLPAGTKLPASRALASSLGLSRITVLQAYDQLIAEGFLESRRGSGTLVASLFGDEAQQLEAIATSVYGERIDPTALPTIQLPGGHQPVPRSGPASPASIPFPDSCGRGCCIAMHDGSTKE